MLQRIQSTWLLLAALASLLTVFFPVYSGGVPPANEYHPLTATYSTWILIPTIIVTGGCICIVFLYKDRLLQLMLSVAAFILSLVSIVQYYVEAKKFSQGNLSLTALLAAAVPVLIVLAIRGIYKDEQLMKNSDRLR